MITTRLKIATVSVVAILVAGVWLYSLEKWPPYVDELTENFTANRAAFEKLATKIVKTEYVHVSKTGIYGIPRFTDSKRVVAYTLVDDYRESVNIEDDPEWDDLFLETNVFGVAHSNDVVILTFIGAIQSDERTMYAEYVLSQDYLNEHKVCKPEHKKLDCGMCVVGLSDGWFIEYWWSPDEVVLGGYDRVIDNELSEDEYWEEFDRNLRECRVNGYDAIGYDSGMLLEQHDSEE